MASIRQGDQTALIIVDLQVGVVESAWEKDRTLTHANLVCEKARRDGVPVIWVQHQSDELLPDTAKWQWAPPLEPRHTETVIHKQFNSAFESTPLEKHLADLAISHIVLVGAQTNWCIRASAYAALERGYDLTLVSDAHTTHDIDLGAGGVLTAQNMIADLNLTIRWLEYPGRRSAVVGSADLSFPSTRP